MAIKLINIHVIAFDTMSWFLRHESLIFGLGNFGNILIYGIISMHQFSLHCLSTCEQYVISPVLDFFTLHTCTVH